MAQALRIRITHPDNRVEDLQLEDELVTVGSGAHCDIRLPMEHAASEHVLLQLTPAGAMVEARTYEPPPLLNGSPFSRSQLMPESVLGIGGLRLQVWVVEVEGSSKRFEKKQATLSPVTIIALIAAVPAVWVILTHKSGGTRIGGSAPREVPELWDGAVSKCSQSGEQQALSVANRLYAQGISKAERRPFRPSEGVGAVPLLEEASACFKEAGHPEAAKDTEEMVVKLREELGEDYRVHRARMEHALDIRDYRRVQREVRALLDMTQGQQGDYVSYLANLDRQLMLQFGKGRK